ncbi:hypothetical protein ACQY0O_000420 [Thecaphora frezii]
MNSFRLATTSVKAFGFAPRAFSSLTAPRMAAAAADRFGSPSAGPWADRPASQRLNRYLIFAEDYADAGAHARRLEVRERHLEGAQKGKQVGRVEIGGALLKKDFSEIDEELGPAAYMGGSVLVVLGESIADVRARIEQDVYMTSQVWDASKVRILPFLQAPLRAAEPDSEVNAAPEQSQPEASNFSLGQLRQDMAAGKGHSVVTLGALRRMHKKAGSSSSQ